MVKQKPQDVSDTFIKATGLVTFSVLLYIIIFIVLFIKLVSSRQTPSWFMTVFFLNAVAILISIVLLVIYIRHAIKNPRLDESKRAIWVISFFVFAQFAMAAYWYQQLWLPSKLPQSRS